MQGQNSNKSIVVYRKTAYTGKFLKCIHKVMSQIGFRISGLLSAFSIKYPGASKRLASFRLKVLKLLGQFRWLWVILLDLKHFIFWLIAAIVVFILRFWSHIFQKFIFKLAGWAYRTFFKNFITRYYYPVIHHRVTRYWHWVDVRLHRVWYSVSGVMSDMWNFIYWSLLKAVMPTIRYLDSAFGVWVPEYQQYAVYLADQLIEHTLRDLDREDWEDTFWEGTFFLNYHFETGEDESELFLAASTTFELIFWGIPTVILFSINVVVTGEDGNCCVDDLFAPSPLFDEHGCWLTESLFTIDPYTGQAVDSLILVNSHRFSSFFGIKPQDEFFKRIHKEFYAARKTKRPQPYDVRQYILYDGPFAQLYFNSPQRERRMLNNWNWAQNWWVAGFVDYYSPMISRNYLLVYLHYTAWLSEYFRLSAPLSVNKKWLEKEASLWGKLILRLTVNNFDYGRFSSEGSRRKLELVLDDIYRHPGYDSSFIEGSQKLGQIFECFHNQRATDRRSSLDWRIYTQNLAWGFSSDAMRRQRYQLLHTLAYDVAVYKRTGLIGAIYCDKRQEQLDFLDEVLSPAGVSVIGWLVDPHNFRSAELHVLNQVLSYWAEIDQMIAGKLPLKKELVDDPILIWPMYLYSGRGTKERRLILREAIQFPLITAEQWKLTADRPQYECLREITIRGWPEPPRDLVEHLWKDLGFPDPDAGNGDNFALDKPLRSYRGIVQDRERSASITEAPKRPKGLVVQIIETFVSYKDLVTRWVKR